jgi:hypothetical protein
VRHASSAALDSLEALLSGLRFHEALKEKTRGVFYLKSWAFLHFHEDPLGLLADLRGWRRVRAVSREHAERAGALLRKVREALGREP